MHKIDIDKLSEDYRNILKGKDYFEDISIFDSFEYETNGDRAIIVSSLEASFNVYNTYIRVFGDDIHFECTCSELDRHNACSHVVGTICLFNKMRFEKDKRNLSKGEFKRLKVDLIETHLEEERAKRFNEEYKVKKDLGNKLLQDFNNEEIIQLNSIVNDGLYNIEFEFEIELKSSFTKTLDFPQIFVKCKIGLDQMYVIRDLNELFENIRENKEHRYGAKLSFIHDLNAFNNEVSKILPKFERYYLENNENARGIMIDAGNIDDLFNILKAYPIHLSNINIIEEAYVMNLNVEELENNEFKLSINEDNDIYYTSKYMYMISPKTIKRLSFTDNKNYTLAKALIKEAYTILSENDLLVILNMLDEEYVDLGSYKIKEVSTLKPSVYIDLEDNSIKVEAKIELADSSDSIFSDKYAQDLNVSKVKFLLESFDGKMKNDAIFMSLDNDKTYRFLGEALPFLDKVSKVYANETLRNIKRPSKLDISIGVNVNNNLLHVDVSSIKYSKEELESILDAYRKKKRFVRLASGEIINLISDELEDLEKLSHNLGINSQDILNNDLEVPLYRSLQLESEASLLNSLKINLSEQVEVFNNKFRNQKIDDINIDENFKEILKDYQKFGVRWMSLLSSYGFNGILADDMGLGKTLQVIALLESNKSDKPSVIVAPASLLYNWESELIKFNSTLTYTAVHGTKLERDKLIKIGKDSDVIITTYDYLRNDSEEYNDIDFAYVVIDEAQYIKNQRTLTAKAVKTLKSDHKLALTGTPIENTLAELWSIFDFIMPGYLYNYNYFKTNFETPIIREEDQAVSKHLRALVEPFILRRIKKDVLKDLPDKIEKVLRVEFSEAEEKLYYAKLAQGSKDIKDLFETEKVDNIMILKLLTELRQLCIDPRLIYDDISRTSSKINACMEILDNFKINKQKTLLFSSFTRSLDLIEAELKEAGISYYKLTGSNTKEERRALVEAFQNDDTLVFLISLKAAGVGLNLTAAENVIHFDPWWNVAAENQASDRAHRIGQSKNVQVFKFVMKDSIEEKILKMQERKQELTDIFVEGASGSFASLSKEDIMDLFKR